MKLVVIHSNDIHSHLLPANLSDRGGMSRIAGIIKREKESENNLVVTLDAGDFLMGTIFQVSEIDTGFQLHLMKEMGYDAVSIGNHEFDFGISPLCNYLLKANEIGSPAVVLANIRNKWWRNTTDGILFKSLLTDSIIKPYHIIHEKGVRVGVFGLLGRIAFDSAPNASALHFNNIIRTARKIVKTLREVENADFVICLSHGGVKKNNTDQWTGNDIELAKKVDGMDLIISAHTHTQLIDPIQINNTPIVQASCYGQFIGKIVLEKGNLFESYELIPITDDIVGDDKIEKLLLEQEAVVSNRIKSISGFDNEKIYFSSSFPLLKGIGKMGHKYNLSQFIADAVYYYINKNTKIGCDVTFVANGMIREQMNAGNHKLSEILQVACMGISKDPTPGYPLALIHITPFALKQSLEVLIIQEGQLHCQFSGVKVDVDFSKMIFNKIKQVYLRNKQGEYVRLDCSRSNKALISISADYYVLSFLPMVKKKTFGLVNIIARDVKGKKIRNLKESIINFSQNKDEFIDGKIWKAILEYGQSFPDSDGDGIPNIPEDYAPTHDPQAILS